MESEMVCHLFPIKEEILESSLDINPEMIKKESIYAEDGLMDTSRNGEMSSALFSIKNEFMESDPLDISTETIKRERIDDVHNDLSTGSYGTINTVQPFMTFMNKKSNKKKATKNGQEKKEDNSSNQALSNKKHRKDKGNRRVTSYMLWSRDKRQQLIATHPELDFASIAREIGKMWSNVSSNEKYNWKRRAKRLNAKIKEQQIKPTASEYVSSHPFWYNADHNSTESDHMDQWTLTEVAEAPVSNRQAIIEGDLFLKKTIRTTPRDRSKKKCCCGMDDKRTTKKKVETSTKSWGEIQRLKYCSRTRVVETVKQVKAKFESEIVVD